MSARTFKTLDEKRHIVAAVVYRNTTFGVVCHDRLRNPWEAGRMNVVADGFEAGSKSFASPMGAIEHMNDALVAFQYAHGDRT